MRVYQTLDRTPAIIGFLPLLATLIVLLYPSHLLPLGHPLAWIFTSNRAFLGRSRISVLVRVVNRKVDHERRREKSAARHDQFAPTNSSGG
jgi:hypothetical protein